MTENFRLTDDERSFLSHWASEAMGPFWGPAIIWCWNNRIDWNRGPYPMAELLSLEMAEADPLFAYSGRPPVPFVIPWRDADAFWQRAAAALALIPRLQGGLGFEPSSRITYLRGTLHFPGFRV